MSDEGRMYRLTNAQRAALAEIVRTTTAEVVMEAHGVDAAALRVAIGIPAIPSQAEIAVVRAEQVYSGSWHKVGATGWKATLVGVSKGGDPKRYFGSSNSSLADAIAAAVEQVEVASVA